MIRHITIDDLNRADRAFVAGGGQVKQKREKTVTDAYGITVNMSVIIAAAKTTGCSKCTIINRIKCGWSMDCATSTPKHMTGKPPRPSAR